MSDRRILIVVMSVVVLLVVGGGIGFQAWRTQRNPSAAPLAGAVAAPVAVIDGQPLRLGPTGPVVVSLYEDFHCPHCADFEEQFGPTLAAAEQRGEITLELYPMAFIDAGSTAAANAMACAAEAGFGPAFYAGLFHNATLEWNDEQLIELAEVQGGGTPAFATCVTARQHAAWVDSINAAADRNGVTGTPTLFLDGAAVDLTAITPDTLGSMITDAAAR